MEVKKNPEQDLMRYRVVFLLVGMLITLGSVYAMINYRQSGRLETSSNDVTYSEEEVEVEQTQQEKEEQPKPDIPPKIEIVEDDIVIDEDIEIDETDTDDDEAIDEIEPPDDEEENTGEIFEIFQVQKVAQFLGGEAKMYEFIGQHLEYPPMALEEGISGRVTVQFVVEKDGKITDVKIRGKRRLGFGCEEAAKKVVKKMSGKWEPAKQRDNNVRMRFVLPIRFQAEN
jgi:protein TonB